MINPGYEKHAIRAWKWPVLLVLILGAIGAGVIMIYQQSQKLDISNYEDCIAAGYPSLESFPPQCIANGQSFTQDIDPSKVLTP